MAGRSIRAMVACAGAHLLKDVRSEQREPKPHQYRLATYWWVVLIDTWLRQITSQGLEQFSSPETVEAVKALMKGEATEEWIESLTSTLKRSGNKKQREMGPKSKTRMVATVCGPTQKSQDPGGQARAPQNQRLNFLGKPSNSTRLSNAKMEPRSGRVS